MAFFRFQDLRVYHKTLEFASLAEGLANHKNANKNPLISKLTETTIAAATSIAEGASLPRELFADKIRESKSHIRSCVVIVDFLHKKNLIQKNDYTSLLSMLEEITRMQGALISSLSNSKNGDENPDLQDQNLNNETH